MAQIIRSLAAAPTDAVRVVIVVVSRTCSRISCDARTGRSVARTTRDIATARTRGDRSPKTLCRRGERGEGKELLPALRHDSTLAARTRETVHNFGRCTRVSAATIRSRFTERASSSGAPSSRRVLEDYSERDSRSAPGKVRGAFSESRRSGSHDRTTGETASSSSSLSCGRVLHPRSRSEGRRERAGIGRDARLRRRRECVHAAAASPPSSRSSLSPPRKARFPLARIEHTQRTTTTTRQRDRSAPRTDSRLSGTPSWS